MGLYSIFMILITVIAILIALTFEDIYLSIVIYGLLSIIAVPLANRYEFKNENE